MNTASENTLSEHALVPIEDGVLIRLAGDLADDGKYGSRTLEVTAEEVRVTEAGGATSVRVPISDLKSARHEPVAGGGHLELIAKSGERIPVMSYSLSVAAKFSEAARGIEQLAEGKPLSINLKEEKTRCAQCGRLLPEKDGVCPACVKRGKTLLRIARFLQPYRKQAIALATVSLVATFVNLVPPYLQGEIINRVLEPKRNIEAFAPLLLAWLGMLVMGAALHIVNGRLIAFLGANIASDLRQSTYRAIEFLQLQYFDRKQVGAIASRVTHDTDRVWGFLVDGLPHIATNFLMILGVAIFLFATNAVLAACILIPIPIIMAISIRAWKPMSQMFHKVGQKWARLHMHLNESLSGMRVVKAFAKEDHEFGKFSHRSNELRDAAAGADARWFTIFGIMSFFTTTGVLINWAVGGTMVYRGTLSLGDFWKINAYLGLVYGPLQWFAQINNWFSRAMAGAERIFEIMDTERENYAHEQQPKDDIQGEVVFENVRFGYDKSNPVLKGLTFTAKPGDMIGLVGKSGAGKSTTINLICRFYEPDAGRIVVDGKDYRDIQLQDLRRQIGMVLQEPFLFNGTIAENIAYGKPGATFDEVIEAARAANAHDFIVAKPEGYDTMVGERGAKMSGGERQRISIARAILHNPRILILDEATSSVDVETERQIQEAISRLIEGRTTFAIAHRLSTLRNATKLVVLEKGEIVEMGTHAELMEKKGVFHDLVETQTKINEIIGVAG